MLFPWLPVHSHGCHVENACGDGDDPHEVGYGAEGVTKDPLLVAHADVVEDAVEDGHQQVRDVHVGQESIRYRPQRTVYWIANNKLLIERLSEVEK